jgi:hypothetical protein
MARRTLLFASVLLMAGLVGAALADHTIAVCKNPYQYANFGGHPHMGSWYGHQTGPDADYQARYGYGHDQGYYGGLYDGASLWYFGYLGTYHNHSYKAESADKTGGTGPWMAYATGHYQQ